MNSCFTRPHIFQKDQFGNIFLLFGSLTANYFEFDIWTAPGGGMLGKRHSLFIELCIIELPLSRVLVEFGLNSIHFGFLSNFNLEYKISKFTWKLLLLKSFESFFPSTSTTKNCKAYHFTICWNNYCGNNKICYSGSEKVEANLIFSFNHLIHPLAPIILKPLLHQNFTQSVRKLKITASMPMNN